MTTEAKIKANIRLSAFNMLARREHSRKELLTKLSQRFEQNDLVTEILDEILQEGLQSDQRFTESFVRSRVQRGQGPVKIRYDLGQKGVESGLIDDAMACFDNEWMSLARDLVSGKYGLEPPTDLNEKQRRMRFVMQRGFPAEVCYKLFD